jgi:hypothetical protein
MHSAPSEGGGVFPLEPDPVPELLEQLAAQHLRCLYCPEPISRFELFVAWPVAGIMAHFACYAQAQGLSKREGTS